MGSISYMKHVTVSEENIRAFIKWWRENLFLVFLEFQCSNSVQQARPEHSQLLSIHITAGSTFTFAAFQLRSLGILPFGASNTITAAVTFVTAPGGDPNDFSSVKLPCGYAKEADVQSHFHHHYYALT
jgi:hypothetical protein